MKIEKMLIQMLLLQRADVFYHKENIIVFSGTQNIKDIMYDVNVIPRRWPREEKQRVHGGFALRTERLMNKIEHLIEERDNFIIGGHSLGGSCAILCASELTRRGKNVKAIYTFGSPKMATKKFIDYYKSQGLWEKTFNYVTPNDIIVNLPIYQCVGKNIILDFEEKNGIISHDLNTYMNII